MKVTIIGYYDADPRDYEGETDPHMMAAIDQENVGQDSMMAQLLMDDAISVVVAPDD